MPQKGNARKPDYRGIVDIPVWKNLTKDGKPYFSMKLFGTTINIFENKPREEKVGD